MGGYHSSIIFEREPILTTEMWNKGKRVSFLGTKKNLTWILAESLHKQVAWQIALSTTSYFAEGYALDTACNGRL